VRHGRGKNLATMNRPLFGMLLCVPLLLPSRLPAQSLAQPPEAAAPAPVSSTRSQLLAEVRRIQRQTRSRELAALAPARLALLSRIVGDLVVEQSPNFNAAAARLNAALSPREASAVLAAQNDELAAVRQAVRNAIAQRRPGFRPAPERLRRSRETNAGLALLKTALLIGSDKTN
jgi:hypothetical protein